MKIFIMILTLGISVSAFSALFPEDGSMRLGHWLYYDLGSHEDRIVRALAKEDVIPRRIDFPYSWIQDVSLFNVRNDSILCAQSAKHNFERALFVPDASAI